MARSSLSRKDRLHARAITIGGALACATLILLNAPNVRAQVDERETVDARGPFALGLVVFGTPLVGMSAAGDDGFYEQPTLPVTAGAAISTRYTILPTLRVGICGSYEHLWDTKGPI